MKLAEQNILIISPEPWDHIWVSKHHYARTLAEMGANVIFANPPQDTWQLHATEFSNLRVLDYPKFFPGLRKLPAFLSQRIIKRKLKQIEKYCNLSFDIIWSFDNSVFFDFTLLNTYNISHIVDLNQHFESTKAARSADLCFGVIPEIVERMKKTNKNTHLIRHGVNTAHQIRKKVTLPGLQKIKALYTGNLNMPHVNWNLLNLACQQFPEIDLILMGSNHDDFKSIDKKGIQENKNCHFVKAVPSWELINYLEMADLLLVAYDDAYYRTYASPHKLMEYLSTGKPIVSTYCKDYAEQDDLIFMTQNDQYWLDQIKHLIDNPNLLIDPIAKEKRMSFALNSTYPKQIERIEKLINKHD